MVSNDDLRSATNDMEHDKAESDEERTGAASHEFCEAANDDALFCSTSD